MESKTQYGQKNINYFRSFPDEIFDLIIKFIVDGKTFKSILETCKSFYNCHKHNYLKYCNQLWTLITRYPKKPWNWCSISSNPNTTIEIIEKYPDKVWDWNLISCNPNITLEYIEKYPEKPWDWNMISKIKFTRRKGKINSNS